MKCSLIAGLMAKGGVSPSNSSIESLLERYLVIGVGIDNSCASLYVFRLSQAHCTASHGAVGTRNTWRARHGDEKTRQRARLSSDTAPTPANRAPLRLRARLARAHFLAEVGHLHEARTVPRVAGNGMLVIDHANRDTFLSEAANNAKALIVSADNDRTDVFALREWLLPASSRSNTILRCAVHRNSRDHVQASSQS